MNINAQEKEELFERFYRHMGIGFRKVEIDDDHLEAALITAIEDYSEIVQNFLIESQWTSVYGMNVSATDMSFALSVRSMDFADKFAFAYSKQVGLQQRGHWELKKDFIELEAGRQVYEIPANREINEVLWFTPPTTDAALYANYGGFDRGFGGGTAQFGGGNMTTSGYYIAPAYDVLLMAQDLNLKQRLLRGDLTYKVTAGANGTKLLHLMNAPQSKISFAGRGRLNNGMLGMVGCQVWYHYYDTLGSSAEECRKDNPDVILLPNEVPLSRLEYSTFNAPTKVTIRQLFFAEAKKIIAKIRGKFSGVVGAEGAQQTMDYQMLITEAEKERDEVITQLRGRLERMMPEKMLERMANESRFLNEHLKYRPLGFYLK